MGSAKQKLDNTQEIWVQNELTRKNNQPNKGTAQNK